MENTVFNRTESDSAGTHLSRNVYNLIIGLTLAWGFLVNWIIVKQVPMEAILKINPFVFIIGYFVCALIGVAVFTKSRNPAVSFFGYNLVVVPFGLVVTIAVHRYSPDIVQTAIRITGIVTLLMMFLGSIFPGFFRKIAGALFIALIIVIIVEMVEVFIFKMHHGILDWIVAVIFCGYIGYDWGRANRIPPTMDNAVDSAASLYMDIINLFLRILRILGRSRN